jgi:hypothetical protein
MPLMLKSRQWALTINKNFKNMSASMNFFQGNVRQSMIQRLEANRHDKEAWCKAADKIANLLHDDTMLTVIGKCIRGHETCRSVSRARSHDFRQPWGLKADTSDSKEILALMAKLAELNAAQAMVTTSDNARARCRTQDP